jgi:hypothetical protein
VNSLKGIGEPRWLSLSNTGKQRQIGSPVEGMSSREKNVLGNDDGLAGADPFGSCKRNRIYLPRPGKEFVLPKLFRLEGHARYIRQALRILPRCSYASYRERPPGRSGPNGTARSPFPTGWYFRDTTVTRSIEAGNKTNRPSPTMGTWCPPSPFLLSTAGGRGDFDRLPAPRSLLCFDLPKVLRVR